MQRWKTGIFWISWQAQKSILFFYNIGSFIKVMKINLSPRSQSVCLHVEISVVGFLQEC